MNFLQPLQRKWNSWPIRDDVPRASCQTGQKRPRQNSRSDSCLSSSAKRAISLRRCHAYCIHLRKVSKVTNPISDFAFLSTAKSGKSRIKNPFLDQPRPQGAFPWLWWWGGVTAFWASPRFGHPHSHIPSVLGIPGGGCPKRWSLRLCLNYFRLGKSRDCQSRIYGWIV